MPPARAAASSRAMSCSVAFAQSLSSSVPQSLRRILNHSRRKNLLHIVVDILHRLRRMDAPVGGARREDLDEGESLEVPLDADGEVR